MAVLISTGQLARQLNVSPGWVRRNIELFPSAVKIGPRWRFDEDAAKRYVDERRACAHHVSIEPRSKRAQAQH